MFDTSRNLKNFYHKNGITTTLIKEDGTIKDFIEAEFPLDIIFEPYHGSDFSFLKPYPKNIRELLLKQIILDTRRFYDDEKLREELYKLINNIDEFIMVLEFFENPSEPLVLVGKKKKNFEEEINNILKSIDTK